jgi:hypothetical protein
LLDIDLGSVERGDQHVYYLNSGPTTGTRSAFHALGGSYISIENLAPVPAVVVERRTDLSWLTTLYSSTENVRISSAQLQDVIININALLRDKKFDDLAFLLASLKFDRVAPEVLIAFARVTYQVRTRIGHWSKFLSNVELSLNSRGIDGKKLLRGLRTPGKA